MTLRLVLLPAALILACQADPYGARAEEKAKPAAAEQAKDEAPADKVAAKAEDPEEGCIYAEGEKDKEEQSECPHGHGEHEVKGEGHFGSDFTLADATPLAKAVDTEPEGPVLVEGEVEAVCQKKGCWMVLKSGEQTARVMMKDHGFTVPMDCRGKKAKVEGTLSARTWTEANVKHLAKDAGEDPSKVSGTRTEHVLTATGIEIYS